VLGLKFCHMCGKKATGIRKKRQWRRYFMFGSYGGVFYVMISGKFLFVQKLAGI
jgi:hypothetical protein